MHGLIFVTWEKYLAERFGQELLTAYRQTIGETPGSSPLASRLYDDATLLAGVGAASKITSLSADVLLYEYGRYFILNGLTSHLCNYVLSQVHSAPELLRTMRDVHARLRLTEDGLTPPLFNYEMPPNANAVVMIYDSARQICPVLRGAIEGAAELFNEKVRITEHTCMKRGDPVCRFEAHFSSSQRALRRHQQTPEQQARIQSQRMLTDLVLRTLPTQGLSDGFTLFDIQYALRSRRSIRPQQLRPAVLLEAIQLLQFAGYVGSTANQPGDNMTQRRYWRVQVPWG